MLKKPKSSLSIN